MSAPDRPPRTLSGALRALAEADAGLGASPAVEARLREAVRGVGSGQRVRPSATFFAVAAALIVVVSGAWRLVVTHSPTAAGGQAATTREIATDFLPLTYGHLPVTDGYVVRLEVPRAALVAFGLASIDVPAIGPDTVGADVLVEPDGLARAVRFVHLVKSEK
jgi:hypothetical protein